MAGSPDAGQSLPAVVAEALATLAELTPAAASSESSRARAGRTNTWPAAHTARLGGADAQAGASDSIAGVRYRTLIEQIPAVTFVASLSGDANELYVSPQIESLLGFTQEEWISDPVLWYRQTHPDDRERVSLQFARACVTGETFRDVIRVLARDGKTVWVRAEARLVRDASGQPLFLQGVGFDITEQYHAQEVREQLIREQAAHAEADRERERRDAFLAAAAHDLKTPLTAIKGMTQVLERRVRRRGEAPAEMVSDSLGQIQHSADKMARLLDQLLDLTRVQTDTPMVLNRQPVDLVALARDMIDEHRAISDNHELILEASTERLEGVWDAARIERAVSNLLTNAVKYSPEGGPVTIRLAEDDASPDGSWAVLEVEDRGLGIPADDLPRIFERFHRASNVGGMSGTGIGLAYVWQVVEDHGGLIEVRSRVGQGSTFTMRLPIGRDEG
jgi:PAS domain S-box-containing protein